MNTKKVTKKEKEVEEVTGTEEKVIITSETTGTEVEESFVDENTLVTDSDDKIPSVFEGHKIVTIGDKKVSEAGVVTYSCFCDDECRYDVPVISQ